MTKRFGDTKVTKICKSAKWYIKINLDFENYHVYIEYLCERPKSLPVSTYDKPLSLYKDAKNHKYAEWPRDDIDHRTAKSKQYTLNTLDDPFFPFALRRTIFKMQFIKVENALDELRKNVKNILSTLNTQRSKYLQSRACHFQDKKVVENRKCTEWLQNELEHIF